MKLVKYVNLVANKLDSLFDILTLWDTVIIIIIIIIIKYNNLATPKHFTVQK